MYSINLTTINSKVYMDDWIDGCMLLNHTRMAEHIWNGKDLITFFFFSRIAL